VRFRRTGPLPLHLRSGSRGFSSATKRCRTQSLSPPNPETSPWLHGEPAVELSATGWIFRYLFVPVAWLIFLAGTVARWSIRHGAIVSIPCDQISFRLTERRLPPPSPSDSSRQLPASTLDRRLDPPRASIARPERRDSPGPEPLTTPH